ncbi:hypothetical protein C8R47DRAFT_311300 [Mycena vitilis]|nr:hypothetical protein C8R47DRAFT_311300 [Mycena vitilis]
MGAAPALATGIPSNLFQHGIKNLGLLCSPLPPVVSYLPSTQPNSAGRFPTPRLSILYSSRCTALLSPHRSFWLQVSLGRQLRLSYFLTASLVILLAWAQKSPIGKSVAPDVPRTSRRASPHVAEWRLRILSILQGPWQQTAQRRPDASQTLSRANLNSHPGATSVRKT